MAGLMVNILMGTERSKWAYVVYESNALDMQVLSIKSVLKQLYYILINSVLRGETLCPCKENALVYRRLFNGERERKT